MIELDTNSLFLIASTNYSKTFIANAFLDSHKVKVVLKRIKPNLIQSFTREVDALTNLRHPNIVSLLEHNLKRKEIYLEYLKGVKLSRYLEERAPLKVDDAIPLFATISKVLDYIHSTLSNKPGFVHYDISDENFILNENGLVKLLDFGTSYRVNNIPEFYYKEDIGTLRFMSPEKLKRLPEYGKESDVYGFGVLAYKALTGMEPFIECIGCIRKQILNDTPLPIKSNNKFMDDIIMSCLDKSPKNRPTSNELTKLIY